MRYNYTVVVFSSVGDRGICYENGNKHYYVPFGGKSILLTSCEYQTYRDAAGSFIVETEGGGDGAPGQGIRGRKVKIRRRRYHQDVEKKEQR